VSPRRLATPQPFPGQSEEFHSSRMSATGRKRPFGPAPEADVEQLCGPPLPEADAANFRIGWKGDVRVHQPPTLGLPYAKGCHPAHGGEGASRQRAS
jgi:hypothetical protein